MKLKHFESVDDVKAYIVSELLATLEDDLHRMCGEEWNDYTDADRAEMEDRISDIEMVRDLEGL